MGLLRIPKPFPNFRLQNRVLQERLSHIEVQLRAAEEDGDRLRKERDRLRERLSELQGTLREKEAEVSRHTGERMSSLTHTHTCLTGALVVCLTCR